MTPPVRPDTQHPPLSPEWQRYLESAFVRDTLRPLLRDSLPQFRQTSRPLTVPDDAMGQVRGDTVAFFSPRADDYVLRHEIGHIVDDRNLAPLVAARVTQYPVRRGYAQTSEREHVAEAFARAVQSMRKQYADSTQANRDVPGTIEFVRWLQTKFPGSVRDKIGAPTTAQDSTRERR